MKIELLKNIWVNKSTILKALWNRFFNPTKVRNLANYRLQICEQCPFNSVNTTKRRFGNLPYQHCTMCGCALYLKTFSAESKCPIGRW